jgi:myo-inositol-1(or 4)-monophosphatase
MPELDVLLELAKSSVTQAARRLLDQVSPADSHYLHSPDLQREIKAAADTVMEKEVLQMLAGAGLPVLSEESGYAAAQQKSKYWFIVDPLDGTFNFVKGLGPSAISVALWENETPIFGVIYSLMERELAWGGRGLGAFVGGRRIAVSDTSNQSRASICTGFPVRFDIDGEDAKQSFWRMVQPYAKVRMLGSAAASLLHVARGSADVYSESRIMLWDVAAGIAIVEGAGGKCVMQRIGDAWCYEVFASNPALLEHCPAPFGRRCTTVRGHV